MQRQVMLERLSGEPVDIVVIGGGATGLGIAVDASSRGYRTALFEAHDFAKGTSSRSTKLVHGGVRYLEQLNFSLVMEALPRRCCGDERRGHRAMLPPGRRRFDRSQSRRHWVRTRDWLRRAALQ